MAIWDCNESHNSLAMLLSKALPNVRTDVEMLQLASEDLAAAGTYADSVADCLLSQQAALADLIANADHNNLQAGTAMNVGWLLGSLCEVQEIARRISSMAAAYSDPETGKFYREGLGQKIIAQDA